MTDQLPARMSDIPTSLVDVVETLGMQVALKLMAAFGGRDVKFPVRPPPSHPVVLALGMDDAVALCQFLSGNQIYVPHNRRRHSYRQAVLSMQEAGKTRAQIATFLGLTERYVRMVANKPAPAPMPLFPDED